MFFLVKRTDTVALHPKSLGKHVGDEMVKSLRKKVEGKNTGRFGFTICVIQIDTFSEGKLHPDTGYCHYNVSYTALVMRNFYNEVVPARVVSIVPHGLWAQAGPLEIFVSGTQGMPSDMKYQQSRDGTDTFYSPTQDMRLEVGTPLRVKLVGLRKDVQNTNAPALGSIDEDFLID
jgi:DNA-directed RNA polymerase II subunit RPB7